MSLQSFTIAIPQAILDDVGSRLARTHWPDEAENSGWADCAARGGGLKPGEPQWERITAAG